MRIPRKRKKAIKKCKLIYDVSLIPKSMDIEKVVYIYRLLGIVVYDSSLNPNAKKPLTKPHSKYIKFKDNQTMRS